MCMKCPLPKASEYRKGHRDKPLMPIPGKLVPYPRRSPPRQTRPRSPCWEEPEDEELPKDLKIPPDQGGPAGDGHDHEGGEYPAL